MCQVHAAISPQLTFWWHEKRAPRFIIEAIVENLEHHQDGRARSRHSHRKRTICEYHALGIYLNETVKCHWPDS